MTKHPDGERIVTRIFGTEYEFWRGTARAELVAVAQDLANEGVADEVADYIISTVWSTAAGEYGG